MNPSALGQICIQVHPGRAPELDVDRLIEACEALARRTSGCCGFEAAHGDNAGAYLNLSFATGSPTDTWRLLRAPLLESPEFGSSFKSACMCVCTGTDGWNDYRLLYHTPSHSLEQGAVGSWAG